MDTFNLAMTTIILQIYAVGNLIPLSRFTITNKLTHFARYIFGHNNNYWRTLDTSYTLYHCYGNSP